MTRPTRLQLDHEQRRLDELTRQLQARRVDLDVYGTRLARRRKSRGMFLVAAALVDRAAHDPVAYRLLNEIMEAITQSSPDVPFTEYTSKPVTHGGASDS